MLIILDSEPNFKKLISEMLHMAGALALASVGEGHPACSQAGVKMIFPFDNYLLYIYVQYKVSAKYQGVSVIYIQYV